jgi:DNA-binding MarR family transcriptional regulator
MAKDVSELYLGSATPEDFVAAMNSLLAKAVSLEHISSREASERAQQAWEECAELAQAEDILVCFRDAVAQAGVAGEEKLAQLLYLALTSRLTQRPVPVAVVGPSAGGKNHVLSGVLAFMPSRAYYALSAMSEHALAYSEEPIDHRFLVIYELAGLNSEFATYLLRSLLSEQRVRYETVEKGPDGVLKARLIEREGPTGLILTTTRAALHPENATRMLTIAVTDTPEQTGAVLVKTAQAAHSESKEAGISAEVGLERWQALQMWLECAEHRVMIPYAEDLAKMIRPVAVRLRRDFRTLLSLIEARAILHQANRERDRQGMIIAHLSDYAAVRELVSDAISEGAEASVSATVRETVEAVASVGGEFLPYDEQPGVSLTEIAKKLGLDRSAVSRRAKVAAGLGYLKNLENRRGRPARYVIGDPLPEGQELLPSPEALQRRMGVQAAECNAEPATLSQDAQDKGVCSVARSGEGIQTPPRAGVAEEDSALLDATVPQGTPPARQLQEASSSLSDDNGSWEDE